MLITQCLCPLAGMPSCLVHATAELSTERRWTSSFLPIASTLHSAAHDFFGWLDAVVKLRVWCSPSVLLLPPETGRLLTVL